MVNSYGMGTFFKTLLLDYVHKMFIDVLSEAHCGNIYIQSEVLFQPNDPCTDNVPNYFQR